MLKIQPKCLVLNFRKKSYQSGFFKAKSKKWSKQCREQWVIYQLVNPLLHTCTVGDKNDFSVFMIGINVSNTRRRVITQQQSICIEYNEPNLQLQSSSGIARNFFFISFLISCHFTGTRFSSLKYVTLQTQQLYKIYGVPPSF